jgi:hypothetical protein
LEHFYKICERNKKIEKEKKKRREKYEKGPQGSLLAQLQKPAAAQ